MSKKVNGFGMKMKTVTKRDPLTFLILPRHNFNAAACVKSGYPQ